MFSRQKELSSDHQRRGKRSSRMTWIVIAVVTVAIIAVIFVALFIILEQGIVQGLTTLTAISIVIGIAVSILTLMVNFFQWHATASLETHLPTATSAPVPHQELTSSPEAPDNTTIILSSNELKATTTSSLTIQAPINNVHGADWGEAPAAEHFYGREQELTTLHQWAIQDQCRVIVIQGMGGVGKTALVTKLARQLRPAFDYIFWRSLQNAPPLESILEKCLVFLSNQQYQNLPQNVDAQIALFIEYLRKKRCLLVLDNFESVLQSGKHAGNYQNNYAAFGRLLELIGETHHRSCLLITSREKPRELPRLEGKSLPVRSLQLYGVEQTTAKEILKDEDLAGSDTTWTTFITLYSGNPLALKLVSEPIRELFHGDIATFLAQNEVIVSDIYELLNQQFQRLSSLEQEILYWLAIEREATALDTLREDIVHAVPKGELLEALKSLRRRSMIESLDTARFSLQPVILEYATDRLVEQIYQEISTGHIELFQSHALIKAQAKDYTRESQNCLILAPLAERLRTTFSQTGSEKKLRNLLLELQATKPQLSSYAAGNTLNLLRQLDISLQGYDFSHLIVRQAYLQDAILTDANFAHADLATCIFSETFGNILSIAIGPNHLLAAGTANGNIELWQLSTGTPLLSLSGGKEWIRTVTFSADGKTVISGGDDETVRLWDVETGQCCNILQGHHGRVYCVSASPTDNIIVSSGDDQTIRLWDISNGECIQMLQGHSSRIRSIAFSPDGNLIASGSEDHTIRLWKVSSGHCIAVLHDHTDRVYSVVFSPDGKFLASGSDDRDVRLWNVMTGQCFKILQGHRGRVQSVAWSRNGMFVASGSEDHTIRLWDIATGHCFHALEKHTGRIRTVAFSADGMILASGGDDQTVHLWEVNSGQCLKTLYGHSSWIYSVAFNTQGNIIASDSEDLAIHLWEVNTGQRLKTLYGHSSWIYSVAFNPESTILASGSADQSIRLWNVSTGLCLKILRGHTGRIRTIAFDPTGHILASGSDDHGIRLWDMSTGLCTQILLGHSDRVRAVAFNFDGTLLASGGEDKVVRLWNVNSGQCVQTLEGHAGRIWSVTFNPQGNLLASGSDDQTIRLWRVSSGQYLKTLQGHNGRIYSVVFSLDGSILASGSEDYAVLLWHISTGSILHTLKGHSSRVRSVVFSSDGQTLASGSHDGTIKLWNIQTAECLRTLRKDKPYERMNITGVKGVTISQKMMLKALGAVELT
ncbi:hypothetical protein KSF_066410 [Reticulibacter mediterranei]|uniref:NACHT domain-containing protein n=1 Tax=Reticulibacter mediterranei TaxID=2778369 RepID=A0A8J3N5K6_9CHLR|nr:NACHT domain-containing protein [Reticulibacter mediterranei]GHO96593.1 hypothetical protein KSF_066410 [Reticulibacter mediterranei]